MYQIMQDMCHVDIDAVNNYFTNENTDRLIKELNDLTVLMIKLGK